MAAACPHCGFEADPGATACPLCGTELTAEGEGGDVGGPGGQGTAAEAGARSAAGAAGGFAGEARAGAGGEGPAGGYTAGAGAAAAGPSAEAETVAPADPPAWEDQTVAFPESLVRTWRASVLEPTRFFARVPWDAPIARPVLYFLIVTVAAAFFTLWWNALGLAATLPFTLPAVDVGGRGASALIEFFMSPFVALVGLLIWTLVLHFFALFLAPERRGLGATARAVCYAAGPAVFSIVPLLGPLVGGVWTLVLEVFGIRAAHRVTTGRAAAIVLLPLAIFFTLLMFLVLLAFLLVGVTMIGR